MELLKSISQIFKRTPVPIAVGVTAETYANTALVLQSEIAGLQLTISELEQKLANQQSLLAESEKSRQGIVNETLDTKLQNLFSNLASPLAQLALLQSLFAEGKELKTENIFMLVSMIESSLEESGMVRLHRVNETYPFDPVAMSPIKSGLTFVPGEKIRVRLPGYSFKGKYICKSLTDKIQ